VIAVIGAHRRIMDTVCRSNAGAASHTSAAVRCTGSQPGRDKAATPPTENGGVNQIVRALLVVAAFVAAPFVALVAAVALIAVPEYARYVRIQRGRTPPLPA
jgi:hypothetical protein